KFMSRIYRYDRGSRPQWRQLTKARYSFRDYTQGKVYILGRILFAKTETNTSLGTVDAQTHRGQHMRWFDRSGRARRPGRDGQSLQVERNDQRFAFDAIEINVGGVRYARRPVAI